MFTCSEFNLFRGLLQQFNLSYSKVIELVVLIHHSGDNIAISEKILLETWQYTPGRKYYSVSAIKNKQNNYFHCSLHIICCFTCKLLHFGIWLHSLFFCGVFKCSSSVLWDSCQELLNVQQLRSGPTLLKTTNLPIIWLAAGFSLSSFPGYPYIQPFKA